MLERSKKWHKKVLIWRSKHVSNKTFLIALAILVGIGGGLAAVLMKTLVHLIEHQLSHSIDARWRGAIFFALPFVGIGLVEAYRKFFKLQPFGHGMTSLMKAINQNHGIIAPEKMHSHLVSASITVGFGGSTGLEAPIVTTGAAIGSNLGRFFRVGDQKRVILIGCGVAAGIGGVFNAPIAGLIFCLEVLLLELMVPAFIPLLISGVAGTVVSRTLMGKEVLFSAKVDDANFLGDLPLYVLLAVLTGLVSVYFLKSFKWIYKWLSNKRGWRRWVLSGGILGVMIFVFPSLYGEGYEVLKRLLANESQALTENSFIPALIGSEFAALFVGMAGIIFVKSLATGTTLGGGGNGGTFAPSLFVGGVVGFAVSYLANYTYVLGHEVSTAQFMLVGMAGMMSGVLRAPLTAIFLIAEISGGYELIIPLMLVSAISYFTSQQWQPYSVYMQQLMDDGLSFYGDKDSLILKDLRVEKVLETDFAVVDAAGKLKDIVAAVEKSHRNTFPAVGANGKLEGLIELNDVRKYIFKPEQYETLTVVELMHPAHVTFQKGDDLQKVMDAMEKLHLWNVPIVDDRGMYIGFVSRGKVFSYYRAKLKKASKEGRELME